MIVSPETIDEYQRVPYVAGDWYLYFSSQSKVMLRISGLELAVRRARNLPFDKEWLQERGEVYVPFSLPEAVYIQSLVEAL